MSHSSHSRCARQALACSPGLSDPRRSTRHTPLVPRALSGTGGSGEFRGHPSEKQEGHCCAGCMRARGVPLECRGVRNKLCRRSREPRRIPWDFVSAEAVDLLQSPGQVGRPFQLGTTAVKFTVSRRSPVCRFPQPQTAGGKAHIPPSPGKCNQSAGFTGCHVTRMSSLVSPDWLASMAMYLGGRDVDRQHLNSVHYLDAD